MSFYGDNAASETFEVMLCRVMGGVYCLVPFHDHEWNYALETYSETTNSMLYYAQMHVERRF